MAIQTVNEIFAQQELLKEQVGELYQTITDDVESDPTLAGVVSVSKTADYKLWMYIWAVVSWLQQKVVDAFRGEIQAIADAAPTCNALWFDAEVRKWQFGDPLLFDDTLKKYYYATIDESKQLAARVAVVDQSGKGIIKVAKEVGGEPFALSASELNSLKAYVKRVQPFGTNISVISAQADLIRLPITITYDAIVPLATLQANVEAAITEYLAALDFNGAFYIIRLQDAIQQVEGIIDVADGNIEAAQAAGTFVSINRKYVPVSGYIKVDPGTPLSGSITYNAG